jgi:probable O-glycosylation ligase (exosortase A-associated)
MRTGSTAGKGADRTRELSSRGDGRLPFVLLLVYLFFVYGRPQDLFSPLGVLRLPALTAILLAAFLFLRGKVRLEDTQTKLFLVLLGLMVIHGPIAVNNYWTLMVFIAMGLNFVAYLALVHFVDDEERFGKLVDVWVKIHVVVALIGLVNRGVGAGAFLGDENDLCLALNMILPFAFFLAMSEQRNSKRLYYVGLACLFLFVIVLTESRGGFLGLAATGVYCWWKSKRKVLSATVVAVLVLFMALAAPSTYWDEIRSIADENTEANPYGTGAERIYSWKVGWGMFLDNPVMGVGQGNYPWNVGIYEEKLGFTEGFHQRSLAGRAAHSLYFTLLPELGLIGTVLFASMIFLTVRDLRFLQRRGATGGSGAAGALPVGSIATALEASLVGYLASGVFISVLYYPNFWLLMGFTLSLRKILERRQGIGGRPGLPGGANERGASPGGRTDGVR